MLNLILEIIVALNGKHVLQPHSCYYFLEMQLNILSGKLLFSSSEKKT
jgi:hypothetical protein